MAKFTVCVPGLLTTVQDRGRMGYAASGFSPSGVMDRRAFSLGNLLVGNAANAPAIEFAFAGPTLEFENDAVVAITGADFNPRLDEERAPMYQAFVVRAGQRLSMPAAERGVYGYLAIANGGVDVPRVMGSASTNLKCGLGGFEGRRFAFGDVVNFHDTTPNPYYDFGPNHYRNDPFYHFEYLTQEIRVVPGPQSDLFTSRGIDTFYKERYQVSAQTDRMGCRLDGPQIESSRGSDIISDGIALGSIQIPAQGTPIVMLADRQTTGGYAKIATVASVDIPLLVQRATKQYVQFKPVSVIEAQRLLVAERDYYRNVRANARGRLTLEMPCIEPNDHAGEPTILRWNKRRKKRSRPGKRAARANRPMRYARHTALAERRAQHTERDHGV